MLLGMGGSGKTQLALECCRQAEEDMGFVATLWVDASSPVSVVQSYNIIARKILKDVREDNDSEATISLVQDTLRDWKQRWLVVFDNYDNPKDFQSQGIRNYIPHGKNGYILFTSRHEDSARLGHQVSVSGMTEKESLDLLLQKTPMNLEEETEGRKIVSLLGHLALALDQAGAYIRARGLPLKDFISHYKRRKRQIFEETPDEWEYRRNVENSEQERILSVFTTWEMSFNLISGSENEKEWKDHFLTLAAFFDTKVISERYFRAHCDSENTEWMDLFRTKLEWDSDKLGDVLTEFRRLSLIQIPDRQTSEQSFSIHPIVRDWLILRKSQVKQQMVIELIHALAAYLENIDVKELSLETNQETAQHIDACILSGEDIFEGTCSTSLDSLPKSESLFASFYRDQGRYNEAEKLYERALAGREEKLEPKHLDTLRTVMNLAIVYCNQGRYNEAEKLYERALAGREEQLGPKHPNTLRTVKGLAIVYRNQGRYNEAEKLYERARAGASGK